MTPNCADIAQWYAKHYPHLPVDSIVPGICWDCYQQYAPGDQVVLRAQPEGNVLTVIDVISSPGNPDVVTARHPNGKEETFAKSQIRRHKQRDADADLGVKRDGYF